MASSTQKSEAYMVNVIAGGQETGMVPCQFCHWTKVEPGTNCPTCNTYMPQASAGAPARRQSG